MRQHRREGFLMQCAPLVALVTAVSLLMPFAVSADDLYRVTTLRAAPGKWVDLKALIESQGEAGNVSEDGRMVPYRMRHSQGAQWDFMLIQPLSSLEEYFSDETQSLEAPFRDAVSALADFEEDWFVAGPDHAVLAKAYPAAGMFLVEMFRARAGMKAELYESRVRENRILEAIDIPANFVFKGAIGADWDVMTIGFYRDFVHYGSAGADVPEARREAAARAEGLSGMDDLSPTLRELLTEHSDTLASSLN
jgi:hypothetical protein